MEKELIIFDMDGTLYDLNDVIQMAYDMQVLFLSQKLFKKQEETKCFLTNNNIFPYITKEACSATELFLSLGIEKSEWAEYRDNNFDVTKIDVDKAIANDVIEEFGKFYKIALLSSNTYGNIKEILEHIHININNFADIMCSDNFPSQEFFKKKLAISFLSNKYKIKYSSILSIGDRYNTDVKPIIELGGEGILVHEPKYIYKIFEDLRSNNLHSCGEYEYFQSQI